MKKIISWRLIMNFKNKVLLSLMILAIGLSACGPSASAEPTVDPAIIMTDAVATSMQRLTMEAIMNPTETPIPTDTPLPTNTPEPSLTPTTAVAAATLPGVATSGVQVVATTASNAVSAGTVGDKAEYQTQWPEDGHIFYTLSGDFPSGDFDIKFTMKNTGTTTWDKTYMIRYYSGDKFFGGNTDFHFPDRSVLPGEMVDIIVDGAIPSAGGTYNATFVLTNPEGVNFSVVTLQIVVIAGYKNSPTPTPTP